MDRRSFLTWMQVGLLASTLPLVTNSCIGQTNRHLKSKSQFNATETIVFYVASSGNDAWSGRLATRNAENTDGPFSTFERARDAVRELKRQQGGTLKQPVTVLVRGGTYFLTEPLVFTPEDSGTADCPVTFMAYQDENPVISGGRRITEWRQQGNLWIADLPEVKSGKLYFRSLRVQNHLVTRARYPKFEPKRPLTGGWLFAQWHGKPWEKGQFNSAVVHGIHNVGDRLEWRVNVPAAGNYSVWLHYAHNMKSHNLTAMDDRITLRTAEGMPVLLRNLPDTDGWGNYQWALTATVQLSAGEQTLIWENVKGGGINLDALCLTNDSDWNPETAIRILGWWGEYQVQPPKEGKHLLVIQAEACEKAVGKEVSVPQPNLAGVRDRIVVAPDKFPNWQNWDDAEVHIFPAWGWVNAIMKVERVERDAHTIFVNCQQDIRPGNRFFIANVREALDSVGEWFLDRKSGELLYWPSEQDFPNIEVVAPVMERLIVLQGDASAGKFVENLHFQGLQFTDTDYTLDGYQGHADAAIWMQSARQCVIENCSFQNLGGYAVRLEQQSHQNEIVGNTMTQLGGGGVVLLGGNKSQPFDNWIAGNEIFHCGLIYKHGAGVYVSSGSGNRIAHNHIQLMPRYGISLKSGENHFSHNNIVEFNKIIDTNLETNDAGAIETYGSDKHNSGNIIRFNFIRNVVGRGTTPDGQFRTPYFTWGIYLDDYSSGTTIYGNIVSGTVLGAVCIHGGQDNIIENNVFVDGLERQITLQPKDDFMTGNIFHRNIVVFRNPNASLWYSWTNKWRRDRLRECDFNFYWHTGGLDLEKTKRALTPEGNFAQWQAAGFDRRAIIADPLFVAPEKGDFRLKSNSPVFKLGFQPIPMERIGMQGLRRDEKPIF